MDLNEYSRGYGSMQCASYSTHEGLFHLRCLLHYPRIIFTKLAYSTCFVVQYRFIKNLSCTEPDSPVPFLPNGGHMSYVIRMYFVMYDVRKTDMLLVHASRGLW